MEAGKGQAGGARVGGGGEQGLVEVDQGGAAGDVKHSTCHAQQCFLWMISVQRNRDKCRVPKENVMDTT